VVQGDSAAVAGLENAESLCESIAPQQEHAPVIDEPEKVEGDRLKHFPGLRIGNTPEEQLELNRPAMDLLQHWIDEDKIDEPEQADTGYEAIAPAEAQTIAPAIEPEPELDDGESDRIAIDESEQAMLTLQESAFTEPQQAKAPHQEYALSEAELFGVEDAPLDDEDPTERRYWSGKDDGCGSFRATILSRN
jgi:hypothetical protein